MLLDILKPDNILGGQDKRDQCLRGTKEVGQVLVAGPEVVSVGIPDGNHANHGGRRTVVGRGTLSAAGGACVEGTNGGGRWRCCREKLPLGVQMS